MSREEFWTAWKNDGCPSFVKMKPKVDSSADARKGRKRRNPSELPRIAQDFIDKKPLGMGRYVQYTSRKIELTRNYFSSWIVCKNTELFATKKNHLVDTIMSLNSDKNVDFLFFTLTAPFYFNALTRQVGSPRGPRVPPSLYLPN